MKNQNLDNVEYIRTKYGRDVSTGEKIVTVEYNYVYAMAIMGRTWSRGVYRHFVSNFARPRLYRQTIDGMVAV